MESFETHKDYILWERNAARRRRGFEASATSFNGTNQSMSKSGGMGGAASPRVTCSLWVDMNGGDGSVHDLLSGAPSSNNYTYLAQRPAANTMRFLFRTTGFVVVLQAFTVSTITAADGLSHFLFSGDGATAGAIAIYKDDVLDIAASPTQSNNNAAFNVTNNGVARAPGTAVNLLNGCLGHVILWPALNLAQADGTIPEADRRNFIDASGNQVDPQVAVDAYGTPTILLSDPAATFNVNSGSGGNYTIANGPLSAC